MAIIKHINDTMNLKKFAPNKIPIKEKWEQYKKQTAQRLNNRTKHWERKQKKHFLILFSVSFMGLFLLSFCFLTSLHYDSRSVTVPTLPKKLLLTQRQVPKRLPPPPLMDSGRHPL